MASGDIDRPVTNSTNNFGYIASGCTNLNSPTTEAGKLFFIQPYVWNAQNNPVANAGGIIMTMYFSYEFAAGVQLAFSIDSQGVNYRRLKSGTWQSWTSLI